MVLLLALLLASAETASYFIQLDKPGDAVTVRQDDSRAVFTVRSQTGIGGATIRLAQGRWPRQVTFRFCYGDGRGFSSLEALGITTSRLHVHGSLRLSGRMPVDALDPQGASSAPAGEVPVVVSLHEDALEATLPSDWLAGEEHVVLGWIDAYSDQPGAPSLAVPAQWETPSVTSAPLPGVVQPFEFFPDGPLGGLGSLPELFSRRAGARFSR